MKNFKFTILITTFKRSKKIKRHLDNFNNFNWKKLKNCKPDIIIADDSPNLYLSNLCKRYKKKLKYFNLIYLERRKKLGQGLNLFQAVKEEIKDGYIWPVGDDDILFPKESVDLINKINSLAPNVAVCEFRQGKNNSSGTFFKGKSRMVRDVNEGLEFIERFGKLTSVVFKKPHKDFVKIVENKFLGCMYEDRPLAVFSYLCCNKPSLYLKTELTAVGDVDYGLLRYSTRVFVNLQLAMFLAIKLCKKEYRFKYPITNIKKDNDEYKWWKFGLYISLRNYLKFNNSGIRYTFIRFLIEIIVTPMVIYRKFFKWNKKICFEWIK